LAVLQTEDQKNHAQFARTLGVGMSDYILTPIVSHAYLRLQFCLIVGVINPVWNSGHKFASKHWDSEAWNRAV